MGRERKVRGKRMGSKGEEKGKYTVRERKIKGKRKESIGGAKGK